MRVDVLYFGVLREMVAAERDVMMLDTGATVGDLVAEVKGSSGDAVWLGLAVAVNREFAGRERVLVDGDEVALLPPVSGGTR